MGEVRLDVPLLAQSRSMSCWFAAACMVSYYYRAGPRLGLPQVHAANTGVTIAQLNDLARVEGLQFLDTRNYEFSPATLMSTVRRYGPVWSAGMWFGVAHAVVVTGADDVGDGHVFFNDPDQGVAKSNTITWFNEKRLRGTMLIKDKTRS